MKNLKIEDNVKKLEEEDKETKNLEFANLEKERIEEDLEILMNCDIFENVLEIKKKFLEEDFIFSEDLYGCLEEFHDNIKEKIVKLERRNRVNEKFFVN